MNHDPGLWIGQGVGDGGHAGVLEFERQVQGRHRRNLGPALDRHVTVDGVDANGDAAGMGLAGLAHQIGIAQCRGAQDDPGDTALEPHGDGLQVADAAAQLHRHGGGGQDGINGVAVDRPSGEGAVRCMRAAMADLDMPVDYINTHGTSTPAGDIRELEAIREVFGEEVPPLSATKSLTGHALGAAGVNEAIYSLLMLQGCFVTASANIENLDPEAAGFPIVRELRREADLNVVMSNSFGFGGTNSTLTFGRVTD